MRLAIMQPYFLPYAGYFRLMAAADLFVVYDCVQFPRRGWLHRNKLRHVSGNPEWLTLPFEKASRDVRIDQLAFNRERMEEWQEELAHFPCFKSNVLNDSGITETCRTLPGTPVDCIESLLKQCCDALDISCEFTRSSALKLPDTLKAQDRILAICKHFGATTYINSPGGRELYDHKAFETAGIELYFFNDYQGDKSSIAQRLADVESHGTNVAALKEEINGQMELVA